MLNSRWSFRIFLRVLMRRRQRATAGEVSCGGATAAGCGCSLRVAESSEDAPVGVLRRLQEQQAMAEDSSRKRPREVGCCERGEWKGEEGERVERWSIS